jgi:hypothetical protein
VIGGSRPIGEPDLGDVADAHGLTDKGTERAFRLAVLGRSVEAVALVRGADESLRVSPRTFALAIG